MSTYSHLYPDKMDVLMVDLERRAGSSGTPAEDLGALASSTDVLQAPQEGEEPVDPDQLTRAVVASITPAVEDLVRLSAKYDGAVVEDEELEDLNALLKAVCEDMGADFSVVSGHVQIMVESD